MPKRKEPALDEIDELNPKQREFVAQYLIDLNGKQAAIRAGYSPNGAEVHASRLLTNPNVARAIAEGQVKLAERNDITADRVLRELAKIGFSDIRKAVRWSADPVGSDEGEDAAAVVTFISSDEIDDETAAAISEISQTKQGLKIKFYDKRAALVDLGKHIGMFREQLDINTNVRFIIDGLDDRKV